jgi:hypothetical protein
MNKYAGPHVRTRQLRDPLRAGGGLNAHKLVAETAVEMANELFEVYAMENAIYQRLRADGQVTELQARRFFVERIAPRLLEEARQALTACLAQPDDVCPVSQKDKIAEALILDNDLRAKRIVTDRRLMAAGSGMVH